MFVCKERQGGAEWESTLLDPPKTPPRSMPDRRSLRYYANATGSSTWKSWTHYSSSLHCPVHRLSECQARSGVVEGDPVRRGFPSSLKTSQVRPGASLMSVTARDRGSPRSATVTSTLVNCSSLPASGRRGPSGRSSRAIPPTRAVLGLGSGCPVPPSTLTVES